MRAVVRDASGDAGADGRTFSRSAISAVTFVVTVMSLSLCSSSGGYEGVGGRDGIGAREGLVGAEGFEG